MRHTQHGNLSNVGGWRVAGWKASHLTHGLDPEIVTPRMVSDSVIHAVAINYVEPMARAVFARAGVMRLAKLSGRD